MVRPEITGRRSSDDSVAELAECYLTGPEVKQRYSVSEMWLFRRLHDDSGFPPPDMVVKGRRYWRLSRLVAWERSRAAGSAMPPGTARTG
jgi:predicted DNA-binding transcriptional regulator AlpA